MRTDQFVGLNRKTLDWVDLHISSGEIVYFEHGRILEGAFQNKFKLTDYHLKDNSVLKEEVQCEMWSSGPRFFTALTKDNTWIEETRWTKAEMELV